MFKSVFAKYLTAFLLILSLSFAILGATISSLMISYSNESEDKALQNAALAVSNYFDAEYHGSTPQGFVSYISRMTSVVRRDLALLTDYAGNISVIVTDTDGYIVTSNRGSQPYTISDAVLLSVGGTSFLKTTDLDGYFKSPCRVCGRALTVKDTVIGYVFVSSTTVGISDMVVVMMKTLLMTTLWIFLAALIAIYFVSERITSPLHEISEAAKSFAQGKFDVRVKVHGKDEIAALAVTFNNMATSLENLEKMRSSFIANVSHELRTPMTTIGGFIDSILDGAIPPEKYEYYLNVISGEVKRLSRLVTSLLDLSRIHAGERKFTMAPFDICEMARVILISFEQQLESKNLDVEYDCEYDNIRVSADHDAIYQIFYNICHNAVKFSREGGKYRIRISKKERKVFVSVYNEGQGIPAEDVPFIFDRFYKSDKSRGLDKSGLGLGMYIAKTVIDAHGEEIWVRSIYGEYCEFCFTLTETHEPVRKRDEGRGTKDEGRGERASGGALS